MRAFLKTLAKFLFPLAALLAPAFGVLAWSGEFFPVSAVERLMERKEPVLVGQAYSDFGPELQLDEVSVRSPQVIALGNSHVGEFRASFFAAPEVFYNTTGAAVSLSDYRHFIERLGATPLRVIIANMEPAMFAPQSARNRVADRPDPFADRGTFYDPFVESFFRNGGWWKIYADYAAGKFRLADVFSPPGSPVMAIGLRARAEGSGFTNDGSTVWSPAAQSAEGKEGTNAAITAIAASITDTNGDLYAETLSSDAFSELGGFLGLAKARGIKIVGFLPPLAHEEYAAIAAHPRAAYAASFRNLAPSLAAIYRGYGFDFYDFSDNASFGSSDSEMIEAKHGSEKMYLRLFIRMAEGTPALGAFVNIPALERNLLQATSSLSVFGIGS